MNLDAQDRGIEDVVSIVISAETYRWLAEVDPGHATRLYLPRDDGQWDMFICRQARSLLRMINTEFDPDDLNGALRRLKKLVDQQVQQQLARRSDR